MLIIKPTVFLEEGPSDSRFDKGAADKCWNSSEQIMAAYNEGAAVNRYGRPDG